jgi:ABC-type sugar transport system substrate-binding protein
MRPKVFSTLRSVIVALALLFLTACSDGTVPFLGGGTTSGNVKKPTNIHVGFVSETSSLDYALEMAAGAQYAANQFHVAAQIVAPPNQNSAELVRLFQNLTKTARDGIAVETLEPDLFVRPEADAVQAGIPVIAVDTVAPASAHITTYIGNDNVAAGAMLAEAAVERLPPTAKGSVIIGNDVPGVPVLDYRVQGIQQVFQRERPDLHVIGPFDAKLLQEPNYEAWNSFINLHPGSIVCLGVGDASLASLARIKQSNHGTYLVSAFNLNEAGLQSVANGTSFALVDPEHFLKGYVAMRLLIEHALSGKDIPKGWWNPGALLVTQSNVQDIITRQASLAAKGRFFQPIIDKQFADPAAQIKPIGQAK